LVEKGWITAADRADIQRLLERKLKKHRGDARAGLAAIGDEVKRSLAALGDAEIQRSLADLPSAADPPLTPTLHPLPPPTPPSTPLARAGRARPGLPAPRREPRPRRCPERAPPRAGPEYPPLVPLPPGGPDHRPAGAPGHRPGLRAGPAGGRRPSVLHDALRR